MLTAQKANMRLFILSLFCLSSLSLADAEAPCPEGLRTGNDGYCYLVTINLSFINNQIEPTVSETCVCVVFVFLLRFLMLKPMKKTVWTSFATSLKRWWSSSCYSEHDCLFTLNKQIEGTFVVKGPTGDVTIGLPEEIFGNDTCLLYRDDESFVVGRFPDAFVGFAIL